MVNDAIRVCIAEKNQGTIEAQGQDIQGAAREMRRPVMSSLLSGRGRVVNRQEAQALAQEAICEEADVQDGCRELLAQLLDTFAPLQEGRAGLSAFAVLSR